MEQLHRFEKTVAGWYKDAPRLPKDVTKWLADNAWWIVIIGVVLSALALWGALAAFGFVSSVVSQLGGVYGYGVMSGAVAQSWLPLTLSVVQLVIVVLLQVAAINPLRAKAKRGWTLLFAAFLVSFVFSVVSDLIAFDLAGIVVMTLFSAIGLYVLFEVRSYFGVKVAPEHKPATKVAK